MFQALCEFDMGDQRASETVREANEIARETPKYILPFGLGLAAMMTHDADERRALLAEGEQLLADGAVSHNLLFFNRCAIDACIAARDWDGVDRYAAAFERSLAEEPLPMSDFLVARARAISAAGRGLKDDEQLGRLVERATQVGWLTVVPALNGARDA